MSDTQISKIEPNESASLLSVIARAAADPAVDVEKMSRLLDMHERVIGRQSKAEYDAAMADMQPELPVIGERGSIKNNSGGITSKYALWEDINDAIKPVLQKHGFALSFRTNFTGGISITGVLSHRAGHREETSITLPSDTTGSKNAVQAIGSSVSYGKRYTAGALLNLTSRGEDDDGQAAGKKLDNKALDWIAVAEDVQDMPAYTEKKAEMLAAYGGQASMAPADVIAAFKRAFKRIGQK